MKSTSFDTTKKNYSSEKVNEKSVYFRKARNAMNKRQNEENIDRFKTIEFKRTPSWDAVHPQINK